jgi:hypothetical protein
MIGHPLSQKQDKSLGVYLKLWNGKESLYKQQNFFVIFVA